ncbi:MAG TPA: DUF3800 domain-containing protein [Casimicrobiaceae bacterium]|nr:DUF3800 domain-containing protein [Casimicrobiaceae bacterium]
MLHAFFDDSRGNDLGHDFECLVGYVSDNDGWNNFQAEWYALLRKYNIPFLHTSDFLSAKTEFYKNYKDKSAEERRSVVREFIGAIRRNVLFGVAAAVDATKYRELVKANRRKMTGPSEFLFMRVLKRTVDAMKNWPEDWPLILIFDDSHESSRFLGLYQALKASREVFANNVEGIMFADDRMVVPVQAADLLACITKREYAKGKDSWSELSPFYDLLRNADNTGPMRFEQELWDSAALEKSEFEIFRSWPASSSGQSS